MEPSRDSPPPPYPGDKTHPSTAKLGPSLESACPFPGCLPSYQSRSLRRHHPYLRPPPSVSRSQPSSSPMASANPSFPSMFIFDPENEHHRRLLRLRSVLPQFMLAIKHARGKEAQPDVDEQSPPSEAATSEDTRAD